MKNLKKVLALVLAFACAFTMFAGAAFTDQADISDANAEAVDLLTTLNIIKGYEDGSFQPDVTVTRAEMAKMIYTIRNDGNDDASAYETIATSFTDIAGHWAEGYIKYLQNTGIVAGKSDYIFDPDSTVTTGEAMKMALVLGGYRADKANLTGTNWLKNTVTLATTNGLTDDVSSAVAGGCTRQDAAQILSNALGMTAVRYSDIVNDFVNDSDDGLALGGPAISVGQKWMDLCTDIGVLTSLDNTTLDIVIDANDAPDSYHNAAGWQTFSKITKDYSELLGQKVKVLFKDGKNNSVIGVFAVQDNEVLTAYQNEIGAENAKIKIDGTLYTLESDGVVTIIDGDRAAKNWNAVDFKDGDSANVVTLIDSDDNNKIDTAVIKTVEVAKVTFVSTTQIIADVLGDNVGGITYKTAEENIDENVAKDDFVVITKNLYNENLDIAVVEKATGTVNATKGSSSAYTDYQIDDTWYIAFADRAEINASVKAGNTAEYVVVNNILFHAKKVTGEATLSDILFVALVGQDGLSSDKAVVMFPNGTKDTVTLKDKYYDANGVAADGKEAAIVAGQFYEFNKSGNTYELFAVKDASGVAANENYYGDYTYWGQEDLQSVKGTNITGTTVPTYVDTVAEIADTADVILYAPLIKASGAYQGTMADVDDYEIMHITGKQLKSNSGKLDASNLNVQSLGAFSSDVNGLKRASVVAVCYNDGRTNWNTDTSGLISNANYGFIVSDAVNKDNGIEFQMFTGDSSTDAVTVWADKTNSAQFTKGTVVGYSTIKEEDGKNVITDVEKVNATAGTISDVKTDNSVIEVGGTTELEMKDFNTVIYTNSYNDTIDKIADGKASEAKDGRTNILYVANSFAIIDSNEIVGQVYAASHGNTVTVPSTTSASDDLSSIQWTNAATGETWAASDRAHIYDNAIMNLRITARKACTVTVAVATGATVTHDFAAGETYEFKSIKIVGAVTVSTGATPAVGGTYSTAAELADALSKGPVVASGVIPAGTYTPTATNTLTLKNATITGAVITSGDVTLDGTTMFASTGSLEVLGTLNITKETTDTTPVATTINDMSKLTAANKIVDNRTTTTAADVDTMLARSNDITVQAVSGTVTATMAKKTLKVIGDADLGTAASDADTNVTVGGNVTTSAAALNGTWNVGTLTAAASVVLTGDFTANTLSGGATSLTVNGSLDVATTAPATLAALTLNANASASLPNTVTDITTLITNAGTTGTTTLVAEGATVGTYATLTDKTDLTVAIMSGAAATGGADAKITFKGAQTALALAQGTFQFDAEPAAAMTSFAANSKIIINYQMDDKTKLAAPTNAGTTLKFLVAPTQIETADDTAGGFYATGALTTVITDAGKIQTGVEYVATGSCGSSGGSIGWVGAMNA